MLLVLLASGTASAQDFTGRMLFSDGDSLRVSGARVRLFGIDAPEMDQTCTRQDGRNWQCGKWAARQARALFDRQHADCLYRDTDRYGRIVATCRVDGQDIAAVLVNLGIATTYQRFSLDYVAQDKAAAIAGRGIWAGTMVAPEKWRSGQRQATNVSGAPDGCVIKGNISSDGQIYHLPGQQNYADTRITAARGERWFCTEAEAQTAGWRRARR